MPQIALVVPLITHKGGVATVADFLIRTIRERTDYDLNVISLAMSSRDAQSRRIIKPGTWFRGPVTREDDFRGTPYTHVGAHWVELEIQRYKHRNVLAREIADCDMIQVVCGTPSWAWPVTGLGKPVSIQVATLAEVERRAVLAEGQGARGALRRWMTRQITMLETPALRAAASVQVENRWMQDHVTGVTKGADTDVVFACPGVDETFFHPSDSEPEVPGYILSVGRMQDPRKNHMLLLEAYGLLCDRMDIPPRLALAGTGGPSEAFEARARVLGIWGQIDAHIYPPMEELAQLYRGARAYALASDEEGFGISVVEAMASGAPPVSTRSGGPDDIIADGEDGYLVDLGDAEGLADRLFQVLSDGALRERLSKAARRKIDTTYGHIAAGDAFINVFDRLAGRK